MVEQQLLSKHGVDGFGQSATLARPELTVITKKTGNDLVGRMIEFQNKADQIGGRLQQGLGMHGAIVPSCLRSAGAQTPAATIRR